MLELKKGDKVILKGFTGIKLGVFEVASTTKKTVTILKRNGDELIFDRKTGKQVNVAEGKEKYANSIIEDDGSFVAPSTKGAAKRKSTKKPAPQPDEDEDIEDEDIDDEEDEPQPKKVTKKSKKTPAPAKKGKKPAPIVEDDEDEDDDDFEEVDD